MEIKCYVVVMGENFERAKEAHKDSPFLSTHSAMLWAALELNPGQKFWICDENGGVLVIAQAPIKVGHA
jgi:hypothetical protein